MLTKDGLRKEFSSDWEKHYELEIFKERGFMRRQCEKCKKNFWTTDSERNVCSDSTCEEYGFIGKHVTKKKTDYIETWRIFEKFFKENNHESIERYPVVDRWRPDLFFTIASIQDFQRIDDGKMTMEYPADPLIVPQMCLRFNDIPNVGVTGRHHTSFIMGGQHSFGKYWKDNCIELNFNFLNGVMGVPEDKLVYMEDVWSMPDFSQFGPCIETFSMGLELVNSVFSQFTKSGDSHEELPQKVIDVGWGHERLVWFANGTFNGYEAVFGPVMQWMKKSSGIKEDDLFERYSKLAGGLDFDEVKDIKGSKKEIAKRLGVDIKELDEVVGPMQGLYAIADHVKTLLFAISDGGIPSNVGGGYNLRVLLRRSLGFVEEHDFDFEIEKIAEKHAAFLKPLFPELKDNVDMFSTIFDIEKKRYKNTLKRSKSIIAKEIKSKKITEDSMEKLYVSHGITPELIENAACGEEIEIDISDDFYSRITDKHMSQTKNEEKTDSFDTLGIPKTEFAFYDNIYAKSFESEVVKVVKNDEGTWIALDKTLFYPEGGGQPYDIGTIDDVDVLKVEKINGVVFHLVGGDFTKGNKVNGEINWDRRYELMKMHSGTHILSGCARKIFGSHIWQAGASKGINSSRIDLTHYLPFSYNDLENIERASNNIIQEELTIDSSFMERKDAEKEFGFILYQGGASPGKTIRVINIHKGDDIHDVEACGGTHLSNTKEAQMIKIIKSERVQDGVNRIEFVVGNKALDHTENESSVYDSLLSLSKKEFGDIINIKKPDNHYGVSKELQLSSNVFSIGKDILQMTFEKFMNELISDNQKIKKVSRNDTNYVELSKDMGFSEIKELHTLSGFVFSLWKYQKKVLEKVMIQEINSIADEYSSKINDGKLIELVDYERKFMIELASKISEKDGSAIIIFANISGDIIAKSVNGNAKEYLDKILSDFDGTGGGKTYFAQGKIKKIDEFKEKFN